MTSVHHRFACLLSTFLVAGATLALVAVECWSWPGARAASTAVEDIIAKVTVQFYGESGCPFCRQFVSGPLNQTFAAEGISRIMDFEFFPWGNAYFVTSECGGAGQYNSSARTCFNTKCGPGPGTRLPDCFTGTMVCQHGVPECIGNRYMACAKSIVSSMATRYMPYVTCMEAGYTEASVGGGAGFPSLSVTCATLAGLDSSMVDACVAEKAGERIMVEQAKATPPHPGVPYVLVNGQELDDLDTLLRTVCELYQGATKPKGCGGIAALVAFNV